MPPLPYRHFSLKIASRLAPPLRKTHVSGSIVVPSPILEESYIRTTNAEVTTGANQPQVTFLQSNDQQKVI